MSRSEFVRGGAVVLPPAVLLAIGITPASAQAPEQEQPPGEVQTETEAPAADASGWSDLGIWGIVVLVVLVALVAWFVIKRPRAR